MTGVRRLTTNFACSGLIEAVLTVGALLAAFVLL